MSYRVGPHEAPRRKAMPFHFTHSTSEAQSSSMLFSVRQDSTLDFLTSKLAL